MRVLLRRNLIVVFLAGSLPVYGCSSARKDSDKPSNEQNKRTHESDSANSDANEQPGNNSHKTSDTTDSGRTLNLAKKSNGALAFGVQYTLASDPDGISLFMTYTTDITDKELSELPSMMYWNLIYKTGEKPPISAEESKNFSLSKSMMKSGQIALRRTEGAASAILTLKDGFLVFGRSPEEAVSTAPYAVDIGSVCRNSSQYFSNMTNDKKCHDLKTGDVGLN